jgi:hypothetical protein
MSDTQTPARVEQAQEREGQLRRLRERETIDRVFAESHVQFKVSPEQILQSLGKVTFDADGLPLNAGKPLTERLKDYAAINPQAVASTVAEVHDRGASHIKSKDQFKSVRERVDWIEAHGDLAYARLPATAPAAFDESTLTFEQYKKLPVRVKTELVNKHGPGFAAKLQREAQEQAKYARLVGTPVKQT